MTDEQIIEIFEEILKNQNNKLSLIEQVVCADILSLINRQAAEIIRLKGSVITNNIMEIARVKRVKKEAKSEAIKDFAERLKRTSIGLEIGDDKKYKMTVVSTLAIDNLVKETV